MNKLLRSGPLRVARCEAPGRLDFLGGVADYSGSLVLEMPTTGRTSVELTPNDSDMGRVISSAIGSAVLNLSPLRDLLIQDASLADWRSHLDAIHLPHWARYPIGCFIVLARKTQWFPDAGFCLEIASTVPEGQGVSSSAALEIATLRAFDQAAGLNLSALELARLGQQAENLIVGAFCGLMDQLASSCGRPGQLLPILCRPDTLYDPLPLPESWVIVGWPSGVKHHVSASPYATARAAAFMGKRMLEARTGVRWGYTSEIPPEEWGRFESTLPVSMTGADYIATYRDTDDALTTIVADRIYPVRAATRFPIEENARAHRVREILSEAARAPQAFAPELRAILKASHDAYGAMGLGSPETDAFLEQVLGEPVESGLIGGRISGGGSGGTVVVLMEKSAREKLAAIVAQTNGAKLIL